MSLRGRIVTVVSIVVAAVVVVIGVSLQRSTESALVGEIDADLLDRADRLDRTNDRPTIDDAELADFDERRSQFGGRGRFLGGRTDPFGVAVGFDALARVLSNDGAVRLVLDADFEAPRDAALLREASIAPTVTDGSTDTGRARVVTTQLPSGAYVQLARPLDEVDTVLQQLRRRTLLFGLLAIAGAAAAAWMLAGRAVAPVRALTDAAERVAQTGDLERLDVNEALPTATAVDRDEVSRLTMSFRAMVDALTASRRQQRQLVMDASHELRTPLTSLRTNVDVLRRGHELPAESRDALIDDLDAELGALSELVVELVDLAADVRDDEALAPVTLADIAGPVVERAERRTGREIRVEERTRAVLEARPEAVGRAIRNLVDNAAKFSPPNTPIEVVISGGEVVVHDQGPGIAPDERVAVFERFHRSEATRSLPGSGLGLAIVRQVAEAHDGEVFVATSPRGGAAVGFRLPTVDG